MNKEKIKILFKLCKKDLITEDELIILLEDTINDKVIINYPVPNWIPNPHFIDNQKFNNPYYTTGTGTINTSESNSTGNFTPNFSTHSTIGNSFSKKWINPEEP